MNLTVYVVLVYRYKSHTGRGRLGCVCLVSILYKFLVTQNVYQIGACITHYVNIRDN